MFMIFVTKFKVDLLFAINFHINLFKNQEFSTPLCLHTLQHYILDSSIHGCDLGFVDKLINFLKLIFR